jgi:hypothetical protein
MNLEAALILCSSDHATVSARVGSASRTGVIAESHDQHGRPLSPWAGSTPKPVTARDRRAYSAPTTLKFWLTKTWCGQLTAIMWTLYSPLLSSTTRLTVPPG